MCWWLAFFWFAAGLLIGVNIGMYLFKRLAATIVEKEIDKYLKECGYSD